MDRIFLFKSQDATNDKKDNDTCSTSSNDGSDSDKTLNDEDMEEDVEEAQLLQNYFACLSSIEQDKYNYDHYTKLLEIA
jgi:hypothetical protein